MILTNIKITFTLIVKLIWMLNLCDLSTFFFYCNTNKNITYINQYPGNRSWYMKSIPTPAKTETKQNVTFHRTNIPGEKFKWATNPLFKKHYMFHVIIKVPIYSSIFRRQKQWKRRYIFHVEILFMATALFRNLQ